jgi:uncharacterized protein (UPF0332 family)
MKPLQRSLLDKAHRSLAAGEMLVEHGHRDFAAARIYYAMFYAAQAVLLELGLEFSKHSAVHAAFGEHFAKPGLIPTKLHRWLLDAAEARLAGDYETGNEITSADVELYTAHAKEFLDVTERLLTTPPPADA